jgi:histidine phosphotransferase ChpT
MSHVVDLRVVELLAARLCHDLIGPVAAIGNGAELLADEEPDFVQDAIALVGESARKANRQLQFYRFAYGFSGGELAGLPPYRLATAFFEEGSITCDYREAARRLSLEGQKLACNMLAIAGDALPRGGQLVLDVAAGRPQLDATGEGTGPSAQMQAAMALTAPVEELTSRVAGAYFTGLLAARLGSRIVIEARPGGFRLGLVPANPGERAPRR